MSSTSYAVETRLPGYFSPEFVNSEPIEVSVEGLIPQPAPGVMDLSETPTIVISDARILQESENDGSREFAGRFLDRHGFVLLSHKSSVDDWDSGFFPQGDLTKMANPPSGENQIATRYMAEIEELIREELLPHANLEIEQTPGVLRRGEGTPNPSYGNVIHNDHGLRAIDYEESIAAFTSDSIASFWRQKFNLSEVLGFTTLNFWRIVHMDEPLMHWPLAVLDSSSIDHADCLPTGLADYAPTGRLVPQLSLRYNSAHRWYYYPRMTTDEVLVLRMFHCFKDEDRVGFPVSYHCAFELPNTPVNAASRQSCEHRVRIWSLQH